MNRFEVKASASKEMKYQLSNGVNDTQIEVRNLLKKISSWKEESQRQLSDIIDGCTYNINRGVKDLVEKVGDLKTQLSLKTKECDDLQETVDKLNGEIRHMSDNFIAKSLPATEHRSLKSVRLTKGNHINKLNGQKRRKSDVLIAGESLLKSNRSPRENHIQNPPEDEGLEVEMEDNDMQEIDNPTIRTENISQSDHADEGDMEDPAHQQQSILMDPWNGQMQHSNDNTLSEIINEKLDDPGCHEVELREQERRGVRTGMNPIPNPGIKEAMEAYLAKNYYHNQDITFTEAKRQKEQWHTL